MWKQNVIPATAQSNTEKLKPPSYEQGGGTGFLPGELFPGA